MFKYKPLSNFGYNIMYVVMKTVISKFLPNACLSNLWFGTGLAYTSDLHILK